MWPSVTVPVMIFMDLVYCAAPGNAGVSPAFAFARLAAAGETPAFPGDRVDAMRLLLICLGGAIGTGARYLTSVWALAAFGAAFPFGTLIVNAVGSFLIAFIVETAGMTHTISPDVRLMLTAGVMGGFTTYSAFNFETTAYLRMGSFGTALANVGVTLFG